MFWLFLGLAALAATFLKLGMLSVWVTVLGGAAAVATAAAVALVLWILIRRFR